MKVFHFVPGHAPELAGAESVNKDASGFFWVDVERTETDWYKHVQSWINMQERHIQDTLNDNHPPYYDSSEDYDLLVMRATCTDCPAETPATRPIAFIITEKGVISVRPEGDKVFSGLHRQFLASKRGSPASSAMLLYLLLDQLINGMLERRNATSELLSNWQDNLLDHSHGFDDWHRLMQLRSALRRLEVVAESQIDAITEWRDQTPQALDSSLSVRFNDLQEHLKRIYNHSVVLQHDVDSLVQIYFSANTQRTNEILQFLAVISAIFLPLNLLAGIFGMNFTFLPLLKESYGIWVLFCFMLALVTGLLIWFRKRRWV
jgi:magnesium transporter